MSADMEPGSQLVGGAHAIVAGIVIGHLHTKGLNAQPLRVNGDYTADFTLEIPDVGLVTLRVLPPRHTAAERNEHREH